MLVKLAVQLRVNGPPPAHLIGFYDCRIGGAEQLRSYAAILGIGFQARRHGGRAERRR